MPSFLVRPTRLPGVRASTASILLAVAVAAGIAAQEPARRGERLPDSSRFEFGPLGPEAWLVRPSAATDLWYHALAIVQADQEGPLGLYSADYARRIREIKQQRGVYPTRLDSLVPEIRDGLAGDETFANMMHFVPLYFDNPAPERLFEAVDAAARRRFDNPDLAGADMRIGLIVLAQAVVRADNRRLLERFRRALEAEWEVFYREYWEQQRNDLEPAYQAIQAMWDSLLAPQLDRYLERSRLTGGILMPSPGLGPEGRIVEFDEGDPRDQVVAVQLPLGPGAPEVAVYSFLKELCFLLEDDELLGEHTGDEDVRRVVAVRCGAMLVEFFAPSHSARYRRVFLDAVGAEESATVEAFERVYPLDSGLYERLRERIRGR